MANFLKTYFDTEGPFGIPMRDRQAQALDALVRELPAGEPYEPRTTVIEKAPAELLPGERADVSWISEESVDREGDVLLAAGMDDAHFKLNPIVTMNHAYWLPPVGRSLWRRRVKDGPLNGIKAKTQYPPRPDSWPVQSDWPADIAFTLVQHGLLRGKSVGFLPTRARKPTAEEVDHNPDLARVRWIYEKWLLLEYAVVFLPAQQHALVEAVSKGLPLPPDCCTALGLTLSAGAAPEPCRCNANPSPVGFTPLAEIERAVQRRIEQLQLDARIAAAVAESCARLLGRV
jgi:hypothetical protein